MQEIYVNCDVLLKHMEEEEGYGSIKFVLQALKPSLISKEIGVAKWGCRVFSKILYDLANGDTLSVAWEWFSSLYGGFHLVHACFEKFHDEILDGIASVLMQIGRFSMLEMFTVEFRKILPDPLAYSTFVSHILKPLTASKLVKEEIQNSGIFEFIVEIAMKSDETNFRNEHGFKMVAIDLLVGLWLLFPIKFEQDPTLGNGVLNFLKRSSRLGTYSFKSYIFARFSELLDYFSDKRNPYAPVSYKIMIFSLIENYQDPLMRELISYNIGKIIKTMTSIPVNVLVEPLSKQLMRLDEGQEIRQYDLDLLRIVVSHPRLDKIGALKFFDVISKLFLSSFVYCNSFSTILLALLRRNIENELFCEYVSKFTSIVLAKIYESFRDGGAIRLEREQQLGRLYEEDSMGNEEIEKELRQKHRRAIMINVMKDIILLRQMLINDELEERLLFTNYEITKILGKGYKGINVLLGILDNSLDPKFRIEEYAKEMKAKEELRNSSLIKNNYFGELKDNKSNSPAKNNKIEAHTLQEKAYLEIESVASSAHNSHSHSGSNFFDDLSEEELRKFQKHHGNLKLGIKQRVKDKEREKKASNTKLPPKAPKETKLAQKAQEEIDRIKQKRLQILEEEELKKKQKIIKEEKVKSKLNEELDWRNKNTIGGGERTFEIQVQEKSRIGRTHQGILEDFVLINPSEGKEENLEKEYINLLLVRHKVALSYLFNKYANSIDKRTRRTFEMIEKRANHISLAELNKMLSDYGLTQLVDKSETAQILKLVNNKIYDNKDLRNTDYDGFLKVIINIAALIYSRPPIFKPHYSYALMVQGFFEMLDLARKRKGDTQPNFASKNETAKYVQNKDLIDLMNKKLEKDPNYNIPPNYKKIYEREVSLDYTLPKSLAVPDKYKVCFELINNLIDEQFNVQLIEPQASFFYRTKVKPKEDWIWKNDTTVADGLSIRTGAQGNAKSPTIEDIVSKQKREKMLKGPESFKIDNRKNFLKDFAERISEKNSEKDSQEKEKEEIISEKNSEEAAKSKTSKKSKKNINKQSIPPIALSSKNSNRTTSQKQSITKNKILEAREKQSTQEANIAQKKENQRKSRMKHLESRLSSLKQAKQEREKELISKAKNAELSALEVDKKKEEKRRQRNESLKRKLKEYKKKQKQEKLEIQLKDKEKRIREASKRKKEAKEFVEKQNRLLEEKFKEEKEKRDHRLLAQKEKQKQDEIEREEKKKKLESLFVQEREKRKREQEHNEKISSLMNSEPIKQCFSQNEMQLQYVFKHFTDLLVDPKVIQSNLQDDSSILHYRNFFAFANQFGIVPGLFSVNEMKLIYRSATKHMDLDRSLPVGLDFDRFKELLLRVAIKKQEVMNRLASEPRQQEKEKTEHSKIDDDGLDDFAFEKHAEDNYENIDKVTYRTAEGLFIFLDLPEEKIKLIEKLNSLRKENAKAVPSRIRRKELEEKYGELSSKSPKASKKQKKLIPSKLETEEKSKDDEEKKSSKRQKSQDDEDEYKEQIQADNEKVAKEMDEKKIRTKVKKKSKKEEQIDVQKEDKKKQKKDSQDVEHDDVLDENDSDNEQKHTKVTNQDKLIADIIKEESDALPDAELSQKSSKKGRESDF